MAKRKRGRPPKLMMPERIPDTPAAIALVCMQGPPKRDWDYLKDHQTSEPPDRR